MNDDDKMGVTLSLGFGAIFATMGLAHSWWVGLVVLSDAVAAALVIGFWGWWRR